MRIYLRFKKREMETAFIRHYAEAAIPGIRLGYWLAVILYGLFGILDYHLMPESYRTMWFIRFAVVIPAATVTYLMTYRKSLHRYLQTAISASSILMGLGIVAMMALARESEPGHIYYYAGLMLVIMGIATLFGLRFFYAIFSLAVIIAGYEFSLIFMQGIHPGGPSGAKSLAFINNNFFFIGANIMGIIIAYVFELSKRVDYLQQEEIKSKNVEIIRHINEMKTEVELAKKLQSQLLPGSYPEIYGVRFSSLYRPMEELGGDYYDFIKFAEKEMIGIFISDVSGHGLPAALITSMLKSLISASEKVKYSVPDLLHYINTHASGIIGDNFITAAYAVYDSRSRIMKIARAGHPYPLIMRNGEVIRIKSRGGMIGYNPYARYEETEIQLELGDKVLFFTDGLIEEINDSNQSFESIFFKKVLPPLSLMPISDVVSISFRRLQEFKGNEQFLDDICVVGMEVL